jgi:hypothetical protein
MTAPPITVPEDAPSGMGAKTALVTATTVMSNINALPNAITMTVAVTAAGLFMWRAERDAELLATPDCRRLVRDALWWAPGPTVHADE